MCIIPTLYKTWSITFEIKLFGMYNGWTNILRLRSPKMNILGIFLHMDKIKVFGITLFETLRFNHCTEIKVVQSPHVQTSLLYAATVFINNQLVLTKIPVDQEDLSDVNLLMSTNSYIPSKAKIRNLRIETINNRE